MTQKRDVQGKKIPWKKMDNWMSKDETVVWYGKPSLFPLLPSLIFYFGISLILLVFTLLNFGMIIEITEGFSFPLYFVTVPIAVLFLISPVYSLIRRAYTFYVLTDEAIYKKTGIISVDPLYVKVDTIGEFDASQSWFERLLGLLPLANDFGDFKFSSYGTDTVDMRWENVVNPWEVSDHVKAIQSDNEERRRKVLEKLDGGSGKESDTDAGTGSPTGKG